MDESELIPQRERGSEYLMLRLRTTRGIEEWEYRREYFMNFDPIEQKLAEYEHRGWAARHDRRWHLTPQGFLLSNQLIGERILYADFYIRNKGNFISRRLLFRKGQTG